MDLKIADNAIAKFDEYQTKVGPDKFGNLRAEAKKRLVQARTLLQRVIATETEGFKLHETTKMPGPKENQTLEEWHQSEEFKQWNEYVSSPEGKAQFRRTGEIAEELELATECFYWIAGRARTIIRALPLLSNFEAIGVRDTRNKLIEHPEKGDSGVTIQSFGWLGPNGPVLKAIRFDNQTEIFPDAGLYANAKDFFESLERAAQVAISKL